MAAGNLNLVVRGFWLDGSHLQFPFGTWPATRRRVRYPFRLWTSESASVALSSRNFCFAAPSNLFFQPFLYCNQVLCGLGWATRRLSLLRRLDQLEVAVAQCDVVTNPHVGARRQRFGLLVLSLLKTQHTEIVQRCGIVRLDMQCTLQRGSGLVQLAICILLRGGFN